MSKIYAELLPQEKQKILQQEKEKATTVFVGDGINDVLALSSSDIGIAMGAMGADAAIESADISLMNENLKNIPFILQYAKRTQQVIKQNVLLAFVTSAIMVFFAAFGFVMPLAGALLHNLGAFFVLMNSSKLTNIELL